MAAGRKELVCVGGGTSGGAEPAAGGALRFDGTGGAAAGFGIKCESRFFRLRTEITILTRFFFFFDKKIFIAVLDVGVKNV